MHKDDIASTEAPATLPETIEVNGVTYRREANWMDEQVNLIQKFQTVARRTGLTLRQVMWFDNRRDSVMPD